MRAFGIWGVLGTLAILVEALVRLVPRALATLEHPLTTWQLALFIASPLFLAYAEGYRGFQKSFVPRAVARAAAIDDEKLIVRALAPLFCMALIGATRRRLIVNWSLTAGIVGLIIGVRYLPEPYRGIVDAGVVAGLLWGAVCLLVVAARALFTGEAPDVDLERRDALKAS